MLHVEHKKFKINFKSNIYFVLPQKTQPTKTYTQIYYNFIQTWKTHGNVGFVCAKRFYKIKPLQANVGTNFEDLTRFLKKNRGRSHATICPNL